MSPSPGGGDVGLVLLLLSVMVDGGWIVSECLVFFPGGNVGSRELECLRDSPSLHGETSRTGFLSGGFGYKPDA